MVLCGRIAFLGIALSSTLALADSNDVNIALLDDPHYHAVMRQLAGSLTSATLSPPETLGHNGFALTAELSTAFVQNPSLGHSLSIPAVHARKGLPYSFELGARLSWLGSSEIVAGTFEAKWALNEAFSVLPDFGVRGHVTGVFGIRDASLSAGGADLSIGKKFAVASMMTLTPYGGWDLNWVGSSPAPALPLTAMLAKDNFYQRFYGGLRWMGGILQLGVEISDIPFAGLPNLFAFNATAGFCF